MCEGWRHKKKQRRLRRTGHWWRGVMSLKPNEDIFQGRGVIRWVKSKITSPCKTVVIIENLCLFFRFCLIYLSRYTELSVSAPFVLPAPCAVALLIVWVTFQMCIIIYIILISKYLYLSVKFCRNKMFQIFKYPTIRSWYTILRKYDHSSVWIKIYLYFLFFFFLQFHHSYFSVCTSTFSLAGVLSLLSGSSTLLKAVLYVSDCCGNSSSGGPVPSWVLGELQKSWCRKQQPPQGIREACWWK